MGKWTGASSFSRIDPLSHYFEKKNDTYYQDSRRLLTVMHAARRWNAPPVLFLPTFKFGQSVLIIIAGVQQGAIQVTTS